MRQLVRIKKTGVLGGVLSGFGEYLSIDPVILRIAYIVLLLLGWFRWWLIVGYLLCWIILPSEVATKQEGSAREIKENDSIGSDQTGSKFVSSDEMPDNTRQPSEESSSGNSVSIIIAVLLIIGGVFLIFQKMVPEAYFLSFKKFSVAFVLIGIGILLLSPNFFKKKGE
ncbi:PspC domain-containing protein [bacterium]|nr:PspC domain-containing protein [bacterium]